MRVGNCAIYALVKAFREGGYVIICRSDVNRLKIRFMHADSIEGVRVSHFVPLRPLRGALGILHSLCFRGRVIGRRMPGPDDTVSGARPTKPPRRK